MSARPSLLFLSHRIPYPPDKGEKIRAWHMLRHLARSWRIHLGCFADDPADLVHLPFLRELCADVLCLQLRPARQRVRAILRARPGQPLSTGYFEDARMRSWAARAAECGARTAFVYCSAMTPYVMDAGGDGVFRRRVADFVDVDSDKWRAYAATARGARRLVWAREARTLLAFERRAAAAMDRVLLVSGAEAARFAALAPELRDRIASIDNGVDTEHFAPAARPDTYPNPYPSGGKVIVFTGTMDYRPNVDAVCWFAAEILPAIRVAVPEVRFAIVGANPTPEVRRLETASGVIVTGRVADPRPYVVHAEMSVAPLRIARGIQNKVLEAMAMARPVVASPEAFEGLDASPGRDLLVASGASAMAEAAIAVLRGGHPGLGEAARLAVGRRYGWERVLAPLNALLDGPATAPAGSVRPA